MCLLFERCPRWKASLVWGGTEGGGRKRRGGGSGAHLSARRRSSSSGCRRCGGRSRPLAPRPRTGPAGKATVVAVVAVVTVVAVVAVVVAAVATGRQAAGAASRRKAAATYQAVNGIQQAYVHALPCVWPPLCRCENCPCPFLPTQRMSPPSFFFFFFFGRRGRACGTADRVRERHSGVHNRRTVRVNERPRHAAGRPPWERFAPEPPPPSLRKPRASGSSQLGVAPPEAVTGTLSGGTYAERTFPMKQFVSCFQRRRMYSRSN